MAKLNVHFSEQTIRDEPTKDEIFQIEGLALSVNIALFTAGAKNFYRHPCTLCGLCFFRFLFLFEQCHSHTP